MLKKFIQFLEGHIPLQEEEHSQEQLNLAAAVLLIEVSESDAHFCEQEKAELRHLLLTEYQISPAQVDEMILLAKEEMAEATDMFQFTQLIHQHFSYAEKLRLLKQLWKVAYADSVLDKYEEYSIRKISDLLYIDHKDYIYTRNQIRQISGA